MRVPQVNERVKEAPASALRAMFAGIGSLLSVTDKKRSKSAPGETAAETAAATAETAAPETVIVEEVEETVVDQEPVIVEEVAETVVDHEPVVVPEAVVAPAPVVAETTTEPASEEAAALPLPNYDALSIASLRARLRNLSADQLEVLVSYEKGHAGRADVITMFERRITKLAEA